MDLEAYNIDAVSDLYGVTKQGKPFFIDFFQGEDHSVSFVFGSPEILEFLRGKEIDLKSDGTFKCFPKMFAQLYIVHAVVINRVSFSLNRLLFL